jgi:RHS repeat-associated protein
LTTALYRAATKHEYDTASTTYDWNPRGELTAVHLPNGKAETFAYDPLGRRVSASNGEKTVSYVYDGQNAHLEYEGSGSTPSSSPSALYTDGLNPNEVLEMARGSKRYSYLVDGQGSTIARADEAGNVSERYAYDAFGDPTATGEVQNPFLYTGQMWEPEAGLYYDRARYYELESGRFISKDPIIHANPYSYVESDPVNERDPSGMQTLEDEEGALSVAEVEDTVTEGVPAWAARFIVDSNGEVTDVTGEANNTISIGHVPEYLRFGQDARTFHIPEDLWRGMSEVEQELRNQRFLDEAIARESIVRLATPLDQMQAGSGYEMEVRYLLERGYTLDSTGNFLLPLGP